MSTIMAEAKRVAEILADIPSSFCGTLIYHASAVDIPTMEERTGISSMILGLQKQTRCNLLCQASEKVVYRLTAISLLMTLFQRRVITLWFWWKRNSVYQYLINNHHMENIRMWEL